MHSSGLSSKPFHSDSLRWAALQTRNPLATSAFVYCVTSTSICCRPTCKARLARRSNVIFHDNYVDAVAAGFRACKRCKPELQSEHDPQVNVATRACRAIEGAEAETTSVRLEELAKEAGLTKSHFHRVFKKITGVTPRTYAANVKARKFLDGLVAPRSAADTPEMDVGSMSVESNDGLKTPDLLYATNGSTFAPVHYADTSVAMDSTLGASEMHHYSFTNDIEYTIQPWSVGFVLIAATKDGICWLEAGNSEAELSSSLAKEFPTANLGLSDWPTSANLRKFQNGNHEVFETVMEALVRPTGKTMEIPFNMS